MTSPNVGTSSRSTGKTRNTRINSFVLCHAITVSTFKLKQKNASMAISFTDRQTINYNHLGHIYVFLMICLLLPVKCSNEIIHINPFILLAVLFLLSVYA